MYINTTLFPLNLRTTRLLTLNRALTLNRIRLDDPLIHLDLNHILPPLINIDTPLIHLLDRPR